ncbi:MAG: serine hydrolase domain-containing protein [Bacteroidales bacterium]
MRHTYKRILTSFLTFLKRRGLRPGFSGNFVFLLISLGMVSFIAQSDFATYDLPKEKVFEEDTIAPAFSDDDLLFYRDTITELLLQHNFNGTVLLAKDETILFSRSFGFADFRNNTPLNPETPFQIASISKTFTAAAVLLLQEKGRLNIDDPVKTYIPEFPYEDITVRMLLTHTSGLHNYMYLVERYWKQETPPDNEDMLELFVRHQSGLNFRPGTRFGYSNTGYAFLGLLIERVSGKSYADFLKEHIFDPLGMPNTFAYDLHSHKQARSDRAYGFRRWGRAHLLIPDVDHDGVMGDKGIYSNIIDLYTWERAINNGELLPEHRWKEASDYTRLANNNPVRYGMGWRLQTFLDKKVVYHPGRWNGFRTSFRRYVEDNATLIILTNTNRDVTPFVRRLENILFMDEIAGQRLLAGTEE